MGDALRWLLAVGSYALPLLLPSVVVVLFVFAGRRRPKQLTQSDIQATLDALQLKEVLTPEDIVERFPSSVPLEQFCLEQLETSESGEMREVCLSILLSRRAPEERPPLVEMALVDEDPFVRFLVSFHLEKPKQVALYESLTLGEEVPVNLRLLGFERLLPHLDGGGRCALLISLMEGPDAEVQAGRERFGAYEEISQRWLQLVKTADGASTWVKRRWGMKWLSLPNEGKGLLSPRVVLALFSHLPEEKAIEELESLLSFLPPSMDLILCGLLLCPHPSVSLLAASVLPSFAGMRSLRYLRLLRSHLQGDEDKQLVKRVMEELVEHIGGTGVGGLSVADVEEGGPGGLSFPKNEQGSLSFTRPIGEE